MATEKDIVLIYLEDQPMVYARIEDITGDVKPGWYVVKLLLLQMPASVAHWILRDSYIDGAEFTMNGRKMRIEKVVCPEEEVFHEIEEEKKTSGKPVKDTEEKKTENGGRVISLADRFKK